jgi:thiol-disulfide isomerase/thioredoxin
VRSFYNCAALFGGRHILGAIALLSAAAVPARAKPAALAVVGSEELGAALKGTGRPRLVHLFASWCAPCVAEWPQLAEKLRHYAERPLDVVVVSLDAAQDAPKVEKLLAKGGGVSGRALLCPPAAAQRPVKAVDPEWDGAIPTTLLYDGAGKLVEAQHGVTNFDRLDDSIDRVAPAPSARGRRRSDNKRERRTR